MTGTATTIGTASQTLIALALCGVMGLIGQSARAVIGLKGAGSSTVPGQQSAFDASYLVVSLLIGAVAGVLAGLLTGLEKFTDTVTLQNLMTIAAAGYAGADFIENAMSLVLRRAPMPSPEPDPAATRTAGQTSPAPANAGPAPPQDRRATLAPVQAAVPPSPPPVPVPPPAARPTLALADLSRAAAMAEPAGSLASALGAVAPKLNGAVWAPALAEAFARYGLTTDKRQAAAIGQFLVEADPEFKELEEDLYYTHVDAVMRVFGGHFRDETEAEAFLRNPRKLANRVYADRLGNGDEASGDGFRYRGRGLIQLTGKATYAEFAATLGLNVEQASAYCDTAEGAAMSGCWYLWSRNCLPFADRWDLQGVTKLVNGRRMIGLQQRIGYASAMLRHLQAADDLVA